MAFFYDNMDRYEFRSRAVDLEEEEEDDNEQEDAM